MSAEGKKLAVAVVCADWRLHQDTVHFNKNIAELLGVDGVDYIAVPGPDGTCAPLGRIPAEKDALLKWLRLLIGAHKPLKLAFVAHYNCAGHPVESDMHDSDVEHTVREFKEILQFEGEVVGICATYKSDTEWPLKEIVRV